MFSRDWSDQRRVKKQVLVQPSDRFKKTNSPNRELDSFNSICDGRIDVLRSKCLYGGTMNISRRDQSTGDRVFPSTILLRDRSPSSPVERVPFRNRARYQNGLTPYFV